MNIKDDLNSEFIRERESKVWKKKKIEKSIKSSVYYDSDVWDMLLRLTEKYDLSSNKIYNTVLREYIPEESLWRGGI